MAISSINIIQYHHFPHKDWQLCNVKTGIVPAVISQMGFPVLVRRHLRVESGPLHRFSPYIYWNHYRDTIWLLLPLTNGQQCGRFYNARCHHEYKSSFYNAQQSTLQWRHNGRNGVSNHQPHDCLLNRLCRRRSKKISKIRVTGICMGNSPVTGEFRKCFQLMTSSWYLTSSGWTSSAFRGIVLYGWIYDNPMFCHDINLVTFLSEGHIVAWRDTVNTVWWRFNAVQYIMILHDGDIKWKHFPRYWPFVRGIHTKTSDAERWCFLWSASELTVEL